MKVVSGDLSTVGSSAGQVFAAEIADADSVIKALDSFMGSIGPGTKLTGEAYNVIKAQLASYKFLMEKRKALASSMQSSIEAAIGSMSSYMDEYSELDTAELDDIISQINDANSKINNSRTSLNSTNISENEKRAINSTISSYQSTLDKLNKKKVKLEGLAGADSSAYSSLAGAITDLSAFGSGASASV